MTTTRRSFMRRVGVSLVAVLAAGCTRTLDTPAPSTQTPLTTFLSMSSPLPVPLSQDARWRALRACWLDLGDSRFQPMQSRDIGAANMQAEKLAKTLRQRHQSALDALVAERSLDVDVAAEIAVAFEEALTHLQRKLATCYAPMQPGDANPYPPRENLTAQAAALAEMAQRSDIDPATVATVQMMLERDIAWLAQFHAGGQPGDQNTVEASPAEIEAADILVELLLGKK